MSDLFPDLPESLSPFAAWKRRHGVTVEEREVWLEGTQFDSNYVATKDGQEFTAKSEEEACYSLCLALGLGWWGGA